MVRSTLAAETLAMQDVAENCFLIRNTLCELYVISMNADVLPVICITGSKSLYDSVHSTKTLTEKRLKIDTVSIQEMLSKKEIKEVTWKESNEQLTDFLTKSGTSNSKLLSVLNNEGNLSI